MTFIKTISLDSKNSAQYLNLTFAPKGTLCPVHLQDHCLQVLSWSSENILCRNILFSYSPPQTKSLSVSFETYTCLNQVSIKVKSGATVQVNTWTTTWLPSLPRHLPQQLHLLNSLHLIIQVVIMVIHSFVSHHWSFFGSRLSQYDIQAT